MKNMAQLVELFSSPQGEGLYVGVPMTFVRFGTCSFGCKWCDTPQSKCYKGDFKIESPVGSGKFIEKKNPVSIADLNDLLLRFENNFLSVTGGEPLEQVDYLNEWLPTQSSRKILLETNGILPQALKLVLQYVDVISMDFKLPSSAGCGPCWDEHSEFLRIASSSGKELYIKIVVSQATSDRDVEEAIRIINSVNRFIPVFIQPVSKTLAYQEGITDVRLQSIERICSIYLPNVKTLKQMHKQWGVM